MIRVRRSPGTSAQGPNIARYASIAACREHTDLTSRQIATIHNVNHAQPALARATVERHRREDPNVDRRYRQLLDHAHELQRRAGYAHTNLKRGLASQRTICRLLRTDQLVL